MILKSDFRGELCEEKAENKNSRVVSRPEIEVLFLLCWYCFTYQKIAIFDG